MTTDIHSDKILVIDFGSQFTQLIARRLREIGVYSEIFPYDCDLTAIKAFNPKGIILSGGPNTVTADSTPRAAAEIFTLNIPVLGICYGMQTMAAQLGGRVSSSNSKEFGYAELELHSHCALFHDIADRTTADGLELLDVWMSHGDKVEELPKGFKVVAKTNNAPIAAMADDVKHLYGVQFHPEVTHTKQGMRVLERFAQTICKCSCDWNVGNIIADSVDNIKAQVGQDLVILGLSGGVDSSVSACLLSRAIGQQLKCIFVDTGLLRLDDVARVHNIVAKHVDSDIITVDAKARFYQALSGVADPEEKRKIIGKLFIDIFQEEAKKITNVKFLAQGTIYSDVIESAGNKNGKGVVIKSHHNVGGLPEKMHLALVEPLRELFKDEVRKIGLELGLPYDLIYCHPFPGPGLGVRVLGKVKAEYVNLLQRADKIFIDELIKNDLYDKVSQAFAVFLPVKSVAVMGDARAYDYVIALRAVESQDFMTANWARLPYEFLALVSNRIINEIAGVSRVVYDVSGKPPATIEWE